MCSCFRNKEYAETDLMRNGRMLLEESVAFNNGRGNPIRCFSIKEIENATNKYSDDKALEENCGYKLYKGFLRGRLVIVKKYEEYWPNSIRDMVFASGLSAHKNVLKLLGCCLESPIPILVFEYAEKGSLREHIGKGDGNFRPLQWKNRLKIAVDVANAIAYLHTAFPRPVVHRNIISNKILLDEDYIAKLIDFSSSISIPEGETHVEITEEIAAGTLEYHAPEYFLSERFNEKIDVFNFGVVLLELLTGRPSNFSTRSVLVNFVNEREEDRRFDEIIDPIIVEEGSWPEKEQHLKTFLTLAIQCTCESDEGRPEITHVAKQLRLIYQSLSISNC